MPYSDEQKLQHIVELQRLLHAIALIEGSLPIVIPDGVYGDNTRAAVCKIQRMNGLPETGEVDPETWDIIVAANNIARKKQ